MPDPVEPNSPAAANSNNAALTGSEEQLRALFNRLPIGFYESTLDGRLLLVNQRLVKLLGYPSRDELMQRRLSDLYYKYDLLMPQIMLTLQREQRMESVDMRLLRYDGSMVWVLVELTLIRADSGAYRVQAVISDVTPRKLSERALRESEDRYQTVVMALMEGVIICDNHDIITACNPRAEQILGQPSVQFIGKHPLQNLEAFREDGSELPYDEYPSFVALRTGKPCLNARIRLHRLDGSEVWIAVNSQPLFYPGEEQPYSIVSSFQDITQRERQMQVLRVINAIASAATEMNDEWKFINQAEEWMREIFPQANLDLLLIDEQKGVLTNNGRNREFQFGKDLAGMVALDGLPRNIEINPEERTFYSPIYADSRSELCTPLKIEGITIGVLNLESPLTHAFDSQTEEMTRALASQAASVLMKMRSLEAEHQRLEQLETVVNVSRALRRSQYTPEIIQILVDRCVDVLGASSMALILEQNGKLREVYLHKIDPSFIGTEVPYDPDDAYWQVMENRQMAFLPTEYLPTEKERNPLLNEILAHSNWSVLMPLKATHVMLGLMHIAFNDHRNHLNRAEREILTAITEIAGISLNRAQIIDTLEQRVNERTRSLQALYNIRRISSELHEVPEMLKLSLDEVLKAMDTDAGGIYLVETSTRSEKRLALQVCQGVSAQVIQDLRQMEYESQIYWQDWILHDPRIMQVKDLLERPLAPQAVRESGLRHFVAVPMRLNNQLLGVLVVLHRKPSAFAPEEITLLESVAHQVADALEAVRLRKQAQEGAVVQERQRLARELHDSVTQALYSMNLIVNAARRFAENGNMDRAIHYLNQLPDISQQALKEMRLLIYDLRPSALEEEGLYFALSQRLETVERRAGVNATLTCSPTLQLPRDIEEGLYRITIEALSNVLKHASASQAAVRIVDEQESVQLEVEDNGKGFDPTRGVLREGFGLKSMRERAEQLGGSFQIFSQPGSGTLVRAIIPLLPPPSGTQSMPENLNPGNLNY